MTALPRRLRPVQLEKQGTVNDAMVPGAFRGRLPVVAPVTPKQRADARSRGITAVSDTSARSSKIDAFILASAGTQDLSLSFLPQFDSWNASLNGLAALDSTDYTVSGQTLSVLAPWDAQVGDVVQIQYDYLAGLATAVPSGFSDLIASLAPLAWWRLGDVSPSGTMTDSSGHAHHGSYLAGTESSTTGLISGDSNAAMNMPGVAGDGGSVAEGAWMNTLLTHVSWVYFIKTTDYYARIIAREEGTYCWSLQIHNGQPNFATRNGTFSLDGSAALIDGVTHMVAVTYDGAAVTIYTDGVLDNSAAYSTALPTASTSADIITLGYGGGTGVNQMFAGVMDEVMIFDKTLSASDVANIWTAAQ